MDILLISDEDMCRSRMAQEILNSFGRGMKIITAGITEGGCIPEAVSQVMSQHGYEVSRKKSSSVALYTDRSWDYVITLSEDAEKEFKHLNMKTEHISHFNFPDALNSVASDQQSLEEHVSALYDNMYRCLYELYRDELSELLLPRCSCGANTYCRCE